MFRLKNNQGKTPRDLAKDRNKTEVCLRIQEFTDDSTDTQDTRFEFFDNPTTSTISFSETLRLSRPSWRRAPVWRRTASRGRRRLPASSSAPCVWTRWSGSGYISVAMVTTCVSAAQPIHPSSPVLSAGSHTGDMLLLISNSRSLSTHLVVGFSQTFKFNKLFRNIKVRNLGLEQLASLQETQLKNTTEK